jgi:hypothetical protein
MLYTTLNPDTLLHLLALDEKATTMRFSIEHLNNLEPYP